MANYRNISMNFWTDAKVVDDFTPEDRYFYLYCLTNPHTNLCGCYEISIKQISREVGYTEDVVARLLKRLDSPHNVIRYSTETKELLLLNWSRYNWSESEKLNKPLIGELRKIKCARFRDYLADLYNSRDKISELFQPEEAPSSQEKVKHRHGEYGWVRLTDDEHARLMKDLGDDELTRCIKYVDESAQATGNKNKWKDWNLVLRKCSRERWGARNATPNQHGNVFADIGREEGVF